MKAERVVVKGFDGNVLRRWMIGSGPTVAYITDDAGAQAVDAGARPQFVVGFPLADVFEWPDAESTDKSYLQNIDDLRPKFG
jgi:hypothetical protein